MTTEKAQAAKLVLAKVAELEDALGKFVASADENDIADKSMDGADEDVYLDEADAKDGESPETAPKKEAKVASETDKSGVEEKITQKYLTEVDGLRKPKGQQPQDANLVQDVAPTSFSLKSKYASTNLKGIVASLDKTAEGYEAAGCVKMALAIDEIADFVESRIASIEKEEI